MHRSRVLGGSVVLVAIAASVGCKDPVAQTPDATSTHPDAAPIDFAPSDGALGDGAPGDGPGVDATPDAPPDGPPVVVGDCTTPGVPTVISGPSRPPHTAQLLASIGSTTMAVWAIGTNQSEHMAWVKLVDGAVVAQGDLVDLDVSDVGRLLVLNGKFVLYGGGSSSLYSFDDATNTWSLNGNFFPPNIAISGNVMLGLSRAGFGTMTGTLFDGTTVGSSTNLSMTGGFGAVASDGAGGFGVVTVGLGAMPALAFKSYNGVAWAAETPLATATGAVTDVGIVRTLSSWASLHVTGAVPTVSVLASGTWTGSSFSGTTSKRFSIAANGDVIAVAGDAGFAAVYANGTWSQRQLNTNPVAFNALPPVLRPFGAGFVVVYGGDRYGQENIPLQAAIHDGTAWAASPTLLATSPGYAEPTVTIAGTSLAVAFTRNTPSYSHDEPYVATYTSGAWIAPVALSTSPSRFSITSAAIVVEPTGLRALFAEPGLMRMRTAPIGGAWSAPATLPHSATYGRAYGLSLARLGPRVLAVWGQSDADEEALYAAEFDGSSWRAPVALGIRANGFGSIVVAASASTFAIAWHVVSNTAGIPNQRAVAAWTGSGLGPISQLAVPRRTNAVKIASDGARFIITYADDDAMNTEYSYYSVGDATAATWSAPVVFDDARYHPIQLTGGPAGIVSLTNDNGTVHVKMFTGTAWSPNALVYASQERCATAVGATTALVACGGASVLTQLWSNGAWAAAPITEAMNRNPSSIGLATDGTRYRLDFFGSNPAVSGGRVRSSVYESGAWSPLADAPAIVEDVRFTAATCGGWALVYGDTNDIFVTSTTATSAYPAGRDSLLDEFPRPVYQRGPQAIDVMFSRATDTSFGVPVMHVNFGL